MKHFRTPTLAILAGACLSLLGTNALAESTYGYNAAGTGTTANPAAISAFAWTNSSGGGSLAYAATAFAAGGPTLGDITVTSATGLAHPAPAVLATASTGATAFARNTLATGSWSFALGGTPAAWTAGQYTSTVTYTATSL